MGAQALMTELNLDYEFLRYIDVTSERQKLHQRFYLSSFEQCQTVIELACGDGDFVELLTENGIEAIGVDSDPRLCADAKERGLSVICQDAFEYLKNAQPESVDGVFSSHLVEHLTYDKVLELLQLSYAVMKPGGVIVLTTPNVKSLFSHLEMFYMHFGHVAFYHPRLLCFFLEHVGFENTEMGENASPISPSRPLLGELGLYPIRAELPLWRRTWLHLIARQLRIGIARIFARHNFTQIEEALKKVDRPFECYVKAVKSGNASAPGRR
jgi:SAM-dependent methyltransferase